MRAMCMFNIFIPIHYGIPCCFQHSSQITQQLLNVILAQVFCHNLISNWLFTYEQTSLLTAQAYLRLVGICPLHASPRYGPNMTPCWRWHLAYTFISPICPSPEDPGTDVSDPTSLHRHRQEGMDSCAREGPPWSQGSPGGSTASGT